VSIGSKLSVVTGVVIATGAGVACTSLLGDFAIGQVGADASDLDVNAADARSDGGRESSTSADSGVEPADDAPVDSPSDVLPDSLFDAGGDADACASATCVTFITANGHHSCATMSDETVRCWGSNDLGESGPNADGGRTPVTVSGLGPVRYARAGDSSTCALLVDGSVWCWGSDARGILGKPDASRFEPDGAAIAYPAPVQVVGPGTASTLATGAYHACLLTTASPSQVMCWGENGNGQSGIADASLVLAPATLPETDVIRLGLGAFETCLLRSVAPFGECIGENVYGELGRGIVGDAAGTDSLSHPTPAAVAFGNWGALTDFVHSTGYHMGVVLQSGQIATWGADNLGQLGLANDSGASDPTPALVPSLNQVTQMSFMQYASCALRADGTVWCWGSTAYGETGSNASTGPVQYAPVQIPGLANVTQISAGLDHVCALIAGGSVECWGWNADGELGRATTAAFDPSPMPVEF
jgi:alpha-tubulin suppressor-like RCC1 family protein